MRTRASRGARPGLGRLESSGALCVSLGVGIGITLAGWLLLQAGGQEPASEPRAALPAVSAARPYGPPAPGIQRVAHTPAAPRAEAALEPALWVGPPAPETTPEEPSEPEGAEVIEGRLRRGDTLSSTLRRQGVPAPMVARIARELSPVFNFRRARPGDRYRLALDEDGSLLSFQYRVSPLETYRIVAEGDVWVAGRDEVAIERRRARIAGVVEESLYGAIRELGGSPQLAADFTSIFAWDLDFNRAVRPGDEFRILYERLYRRDEDGTEHFIGPGGILAARYRTAEREYTALYFETEEGRGGYYRPNGQSVERMFLAAPLRYRRISSSYNPARLHPILKVRRPHFGIDYAAPVGTPVWAVGDGTVIFRGRAGGFGRLVKIRHGNGYVSYYAHLSRYAKGLHVGQVVRQKQVIGYVGSSGLSTGPHVCFRIQKDGRYVNPAALRTPAGDPIPSGLMPRFEATRDALLAALGPPPLVATDEAL